MAVILVNLSNANLFQANEATDNVHFEELILLQFEAVSLQNQDLWIPLTMMNGDRWITPCEYL